MSGSNCNGCSRRDLIRGIALTAAGAALAACGGGGGAGLDAGPDGAPGDAAQPITAMCGANVCIDLTNPAAARLLTVGGTQVIIAGAARLIVLRQSATSFVVLSDICTHAGCAVGFNATLDQMTCPCHGSRFNLQGVAVRGPATLPLKSYMTTFDETAQLLTILL